MCQLTANFLSNLRRSRHFLANIITRAIIYEMTDIYIRDALIDINCMKETLNLIPSVRVFSASHYKDVEIFRLGVSREQGGKIFARISHFPSSKPTQ